jgi:hypothetical protein
LRSKTFQNVPKRSEPFRGVSKRSEPFRGVSKRSETLQNFACPRAGGQEIFKNPGNLSEKIGHARPAAGKLGRANSSFFLVRMDGEYIAP